MAVYAKLLAPGNASDGAELRPVGDINPCVAVVRNRLGS